MKKSGQRKVVDDLFDAEFPAKITHDRSTDLSDVLRRRMEIHLTRTHFGEALFVGADTGRHIWPKMTYGRTSGYDDMYPECNVGGWRTRFDAGIHGQANPNILVALYYRGELDEMDDHPIYHIYGGVALVIIRGRVKGEIVRKEVFMQAPTARHSYQIFTHDGLAAMHDVLCGYHAHEPQDLSWIQHTKGEVIPDTLANHADTLRQLDEADVDKKARDILRWGIKRVEDNFGQGPFNLK